MMKIKYGSKQPAIRDRRQNKFNFSNEINHQLHVKMRYSIEPRNSIYVKSYGFLSFPKNMGKSQKLLHSAKNSTTDVINTGSKRINQKTAEATGDLIGNYIADKTTSVSTELYSKKI